MSSPNDSSKKLATVNFDELESPTMLSMKTRSPDYYKKASCALHFLDQTLKLTRNPHELDKLDASVPSPAGTELLYNGVTKEGEGRAAYLKHQKTIGPQEKNLSPETSAQDVGWRVPNLTYVMSPHARKPLIRETFYRSTGVLNHKI
uniref:Sperm microtubule inner protein 1 C-terminal domain-containing protein n=1 Tax=Chromera velia CCMP2878 TaxID=1169474 RepID=A0A0G4F8Q1_9ALVE|eukprot:Cvel_15813.t1-p1 / transcript=Cvel_15813.t1 / gene=Cvel_15813 / organism=Chromera_velia_CCMP2878 / gene_product=hypothetical protein / transcript_product=hypothetical protein / location=Cvel_scaffold1187:48675-50528(-) / protein_length=146 / sequence_SO=supercontig / SO=protein_coding / is_pseudo=false